MSFATKSFSLKKFARNNSAIVTFFLIFIVSVILKSDVFLSYNNIINILRNNSIIGIIALGMTLIIITGGIDLSVGSQMVIIGIGILAVTNLTGNIFLGLLVGMGIGIILGTISGSLVAKFKLPAFIVTLGTMSIYRSVSQYLLNGGGIMIDNSVKDSFVAISNYNLFGVLPMPILYWIFISICVYLFAVKTTTGRHVYAVGSNEKATMLSGINVDRVKIIIYSLSGFLVALAAIVEGSRLGSMNSASSGASYEMDAIAAAVVGGTSMSGGKGKIIGTVCGTLTLGIINNMMTLLGVPPFLVGAVKGLIIICAVLLQRE
ncbi:MAG TPA: ribose ABC transporter permease [Firmicutes bacterium]|jgi:ribose transport system permease protein|nr:ribose ABC transporter permease [Bacillota bacterium]